MAARHPRPDEREELFTALNTLGMCNGLPSSAHELADIDGKHQGIRAGRDIAQGSLILSEAPLFSVPGCTMPALTPANEAAIIRAVEGLEQADLHQFRALFCPRNLAGQRRNSSVRRFEVTNFQINSTEDRWGIFIEAARFNHSCNPNAHFDYNQTLNQLTVHAIKHIGQGEEILVNYLASEWYRPREFRRRELKNHYRFTCDCDSCQGTSPYQRLRQVARDSISNLWNDISTYQQGHWQVAETRYEYLNKLQTLGDKLRNEALWYPAHAEQCEWLAEFFNEELKVPPREAVVHHDECRAKGLEAARERLRLDVMATGHSSPKVSETLSWMRRLDFGRGLCLGER